MAITMCGRGKNLQGQWKSPEKVKFFLGTNGKFDVTDNTLKFKTH